MEAITVGHSSPRIRINYKPEVARKKAAHHRFPTQRVNYILIPKITQYAKYAGTSDIINPTQKPLTLSQLFIERYTNPGGRVLVLGSGSGSEVMSAVMLGRSVVAVDSDPTQLAASRVRLSQMMNYLEKEKDKKKKAALKDAKAQESKGVVVPSGPCSICNKPNDENSELCRKCSKGAHRACMTACPQCLLHYCPKHFPDPSCCAPARPPIVADEISLVQTPKPHQSPKPAPEKTPAKTKKRKVGEITPSADDGKPKKKKKPSKSKAKPKPKEHKGKNKKSRRSGRGH